MKIRLKSSRAVRALCAILVLLSLIGCGGADKAVNVPRPYAWPRIEVYPDSLTDLHVGPVRWMANASVLATVRSGNANSVWADIRYPAYQATLFLTFINCDRMTADSIIANRRHRIALNLGDTPASKEMIVSTDSMFDSELVIASAVSPAPLQFVSSGERMVVTGTLFFDRAPESYDSVRPIVDALRSEMVRALKSLRYETDL